MEDIGLNGLFLDTSTYVLPALEVRTNHV